MANSIKKGIKYQIKKIKIHPDKRGWFGEMIKKSEFKDIPSPFIPYSKKNLEIKQVSVFSIKPDQIRGNHYHLKKVEWFLPITGETEYYLEDPQTKKRTRIKVSSKRPKVITIFPKIAHAVKNTGKETVFGVEAQNDIFNPKKPDQVFYQVI